MRFTLLAVSGLLLVACVSAEDEEAVVREAMRPTIQEVVGKEYPLAPAIPVTDCIMDHATEEERARIAQASLQGVSGRDNLMVVRIVNRAETQSCIADAGVPLGFF